MSDSIGRITVPTFAPAAVFPLRTDFPHGRAQKRPVVTHQFGAANAKIEQRFFVGSPATRYTFRRAQLNNTERAQLRNFWEARRGGEGSFYYDVPTETGTFQRVTVRFENAPLTLEELSDSACGSGLTFVEIPDPSLAPAYDLSAAVTRFPGSTLGDALLDQVQEIIPLVRIRVLESAVNDILLSDRRVTVGSHLYLPRLLRIGEGGSGALVTQSIDGSSDDVSFSFGNADRVMTQLVNDTQLRDARIELSLFHTGTCIRLDLWAGYVQDWQYDKGPEFGLRASDILSSLSRTVPVGVLSRRCWRRYSLDGCPAQSGTQAIDTTHFPDSAVTGWQKDGSGQPLPRNQWCDNGYNTPNGCMAHQVLTAYGATYCSPQGVLLRSGGIGWSPGFNGGMALISPIGALISTVSTWYPRTSIIADSIFGSTLPEIWHNDDGQPQYALPVPCKIAAGRDEDQFYAALGIVGAGPLGAFSAPQMIDLDGDGKRETFIGSTLDGQPNHGFQVDSNGNLKSGANATYGLRQALGTDPAGQHDYFSQSRTSNTGKGWFTQAADGSPMEEIAYASSAYNHIYAAGVAFCDMRRTKPSSDPLTAPGQHTMIASISQGLSAFAWTAPGSRYTLPGCTNPVWVSVNTYLRALGLASAAAAVQEGTFDVPAAIAAANIANSVVDRIIGGGTETQFRFKGVINDSKAARDWLQAILSSSLGYYTWSFGKLKIGTRINASAAAAFTDGNVLFQSLHVSPIVPRFEKLTVSFTDQEYTFQANTVEYTDQDHAARYQRLQNPLVGEFPLSGCSTKSQAARLAIVRCREELGGVTQHEQDAAAQVSFRTTILGLDVEPGMMVSVTDADLPGGSVKIRIEAMSVNRDWSIDIRGRTVVDSMYDVTVGPRPADVAPAPLPVEPLRDSSVAPQPAWDLGVSDVDSTAIQFSNLRFDDLVNTNTVTSATLAVFYVDESVSDGELSADLTADTTSITLGSAFSTGDIIQIDAEIILLGEPTAGVFAVTRAVLNSHGGHGVAHSAGATIRKVPYRIVLVPFPPAFFSGPNAADWVLPVSLPGMKVVASDGFVTNAYGDSLYYTLCLTGNADQGVRLDSVDQTVSESVVVVTH